MNVPNARQEWSSSVATVTIGAGADRGGTRGSTVTAGGQSRVPFLEFEGEEPNPPVIAAEVLDSRPDDWPEELENVYGDVWSDTEAWTARAGDLCADLVSLHLNSTHPDAEDRTPAQAAETVRSALAASDLPMIIWGCGHPEKDRLVMPAVAEAAAGENCLLGAATETDYRTIVAAAQAYGHKLIALAPCDVNKQKQVNVLVTDAGYPAENLVMYPTTAALGYGMEYIYSILERGRLAALTGDALMAHPSILEVGAEAWHAKEARSGDEFADKWGPAAHRGPTWEVVTATNYLQAGVDILVMRHPRAMEAVRRTIRELSAEPAPCPGD